MLSIWEHDGDNGATRGGPNRMQARPPLVFCDISTNIFRLANEGMEETH